MNKDDEYRRNAAEAQGWADRAKSDDDRAAWLRVVQGWLGLLRKRPQSDDENFEAETKARRTGQEDSSRSH